MGTNFKQFLSKVAASIAVSFSLAGPILQDIQQGNVPTHVQMIVSADEKEGDINSTDSYYKWTQYKQDYNQDWANKWGEGNQYCYVVSIAIQASRAGIKKVGKENLNPLSLGEANGKPEVGFQIKGLDFKEDGNPNYSPSGVMGKEKAQEAIQKVIDADNYPIIRIGGIDGKSASPGFPDQSTHFMAVRSYKDGKITLYDPARNKSGSGKDQVSYKGEEKLWDNITAVHSWSGGDIPFSKADSKEAFSGQGDGDSDKNSSKDSNTTLNGQTVHKLFTPGVTRVEPSISNLGINKGAGTAGFSNESIDRVDGSLDKIMGYMPLLFIIPVYSSILFLVIMLILVNLKLGAVSDMAKGLNEKLRLGLLIKDSNDPIKASAYYFVSTVVFISFLWMAYSGSLMTILVRIFDMLLKYVPL